MNEQASAGGVSYKQVGADYFEKRGLKRYAKVWSLWALGVGAVISGHYSGWNFGLANGWGSMLVALVHHRRDVLGAHLQSRRDVARRCRTPAPRIRSRAAPWGPGAACSRGSPRASSTSSRRRSSCSSSAPTSARIFGTGPEFQPVWWAGSLHRVPRCSTCSASSCRSECLGDRDRAGAADPRGVLGQRDPVIDFDRWALNIGVGADGAKIELPEGGGSLVPVRLQGRARDAAVRGVAVPRDRAAAARRGGIRGPEEATCRRA